ncbi:MAG: C40 family peptidase [Nocardioidaceae bacterium]|nr:C40 family peptidase [Nocardioidaceae bacterium]
MSNGRTHHMPSFATRTALGCCAALIASLVLAPAGAADPDGPDSGPDKPSIAEVKRQLDALGHESEIASENLNAVRVDMHGAQERLDTLEADVTRQQTRVERLRGRVVAMAVDDYQVASTSSPATALFTADDAGQLLDEMATASMVADQQAGLLLKLRQQQKQLGIQALQAEDAVDALTDDKREAAKHQAELDGSISESTKLLGQLKEEARARVRALQAAAQVHPEVAAQPSPAVGAQPNPAVETQPNRGQPRLSLGDVPASDRAQIAVQTALDQVGDSYVYGAAGPDSFDCSGLTMYAWQSAGVSIPHASSAQPSAGTPVSISALQPGDLVFYYSPISHVGMYIGNGLLVHAANPSRPVEVVPVDSMPISSAVRIA